LQMRPNLNFSKAEIKLYCSNVNSFQSFAWVVLIMSFHVHRLIINISWSHEKLHVALDQKVIWHDNFRFA
jgi:hypothetical protein